MSREQQQAVIQTIQFMHPYIYSFIHSVPSLRLLTLNCNNLHLAEAKAFRAFTDCKQQALLQFLLALVLGQVQLVKTVNKINQIDNQ